MEKPKYLVTATLLNSFLYMMNDSYEDSKESFEGTLRKDAFEPNEYILNGFKFEKDVEDVTKGVRLEDADKGYIQVVTETAEIVSGGRWQVGGSYRTEIDGHDIVLYARVDVLKAGVAYDLKRVHRTPTIPKYADSVQHRIYLLSFPGLVKAEYLICDGSNLYREEYRPGDERSVLSVVEGLLTVLKSRDEYWKEFDEKWRSKY